MSVIGKIGIINHGNNCYLNSVLQFLSQAFKANQELLKYKDSSTIYSFFVPFIINKWSNTSIDIYNPTNIKFLIAKKNRQFFNNNQQDSHEFLVCLMDVMENKTIKTFFDSKILSIIKCNKCSLISHTRQSIRFVSLSINDNVCDLTSSFREFTSKENLKGTWKCEKCKNNDGSKQITFERWSPYIIIHLKRFKWNNNGERINTKFSFPINWSIKEMRHHKYKLISIINHYGSFNGGHYTSCGRVKNNKWLSYNDSKINEINLDKIKNNFKVSSYLLLYEKIVNQPKK